MRLTASKDLTAIRVAAKVAIDARAGELRGLFFAAAPGQEAEYHIKEDEAKRFKVDPDAGTKTEHELDAEYPLLSSDAVVDNVTRGEAGDAILYQAGVWKTALAVINQMRRGKKLEVAAATTVAGIDALVAGMSQDELFTLAPELEAAAG